MTPSGSFRKILLSLKGWIFMLLGTAKLVITPPRPVRLCGYATRKTPFEGVLEDIYLRVQLHRQDENELLFLCADLLWWGSDFVDRARTAVSAKCGIPADHIFFCATHNHSGPPTSALFTPSLETFDAGYAEYLLAQVLEGARLAAQDLEPVEAFRHDGEASFNVFRRVQTPNGIKMLPNYEVPADRTLTVLALRRPDGSLKGSMVHYPCHANLSDGNAVQPEYPGVALRLLDDKNPGSVSVFLQGCTADLRPNSVLGERFVSVGYDKVLLLGADFFEAAQKLLCGAGIPIQPELRAGRTRTALPLVGVLDEERLQQLADGEPGLDAEWARTVLQKGNPPQEFLELSCVDYGPGLRIYTFNGEVSQYYAAYARTLQPGAICAAYTNGMIGYLCTAEQIAQGGYEPDESAKYFALAGTYPKEIERLIHHAMDEITTK